MSTQRAGMHLERIAIIGTGLIGTSLALALRAQAGPELEIVGFDGNAFERAAAIASGAFAVVEDSRNGDLERVYRADTIVLATPVLAMLDWMQQLAPKLHEQQLVTDVGSTKLQICLRAAELFNKSGQARFLPGHPMAGKEVSGAAQAEAALFTGATWLFTPIAPAGDLERAWRVRVEQMGAVIREIDPAEHDEVLAWVSHLPQMLSTALAAELEERFGGEPAEMEAVRAIGARALRETTRLGASPYSMWRDVALSNSDPLASALHALEQRLQHMRENLRTAELREEFRTANRFRAR